MSDLLTRAGRLFLAPAGAMTPAVAPRTAVSGPPSVQAAAVLGGVGHAAGVARLVASVLRGRSGVGCALVGEWRAEPAPAPPRTAATAARPARRLAERLASRGLEAQPQGRSVLLGLPADADEAATAWSRAISAAEGPAVLAVAGPRPPAFDPLLAEQDVVVLVAPDGAEPALLELALDGLAALGAPVVACRPVPPAAARLAAASSVARARLLGPEVVDALRAVA